MPLRRVLKFTVGTGLGLCLSFLSLQAAAMPFNFVGSGGSNVDEGFPGVSFDIVASGPGAIIDLNFAVHLFNERDLLPPLTDTMAWGDLNVTLSHNDVTVQLWLPGNPGETSDLFVVLDDESTEGETLNDVLDAAGLGAAPTLPPQPFTSGGPYSPVNPNDIAASYEPYADLSAFDDVDLAGTWTLTIFDTVVPDEGDTLLGWQIFGTTDAASVPEPTTILLLSLGLAGLGFARRTAGVTGRHQ